MVINGDVASSKTNKNMFFMVVSNEYGSKLGTPGVPQEFDG